MAEAGFTDVPVLSMGFGEKTSWLGINWRKLLQVVFASILYADCISKFHHAAAVREKTRGYARTLTDKYLRLAAPLIERGDRDGLYELLGEAENILDIVLRTVPEGRLSAVKNIRLRLYGYELSARSRK